MSQISALLITLMLAAPAMSVELFRYRGAAKDGGTLEYVFEAGEQNSPNAVTKEKAAEIAAAFMTTFYHLDTHRLYTVRQLKKRLCPLLPDFLETSPSKIIRSHDHPKFYICVESEEPWFSKAGNL